MGRRRPSHNAVEELNRHGGHDLQPMTSYGMGKAHLVLRSSFRTARSTTDRWEGGRMDELAKRALVVGPAFQQNGLA